VEKASGGAKKIAWMEVFAGETAKNKFDNWLPDDTVDAFKEYLVGIKGPLDHARRRRHPLAERRAAPAARSLRLPPPRAMFTGVPSPGEASGEGRTWSSSVRTPRTLRRHRIRRRHARGAEGPGFSAKEFSKDSKRSASAPNGRGGILERVGAKDFPSDVKVCVGIKPSATAAACGLIHSAISYAIKFKAQERDARAQGQHHEVHGRGVPRLGL
jgi:isocitrate dehydrogenase